MSVVVALDDSDFAPVVAEHALAEAARRGVPLHAVHVFQVPWSLYVSYGAPPIDTDRLRKFELDRVWNLVDPVLDQGDVPVERVELEGYPPDAVLGYAGEAGADLIVVGTRGRGDFRSMMLGSVSHRIIQGAPCDVIVITPGVKGRAS